MGLAVVIMGVSGCGKSTVGAALAEALGWLFLEADDFHSRENKDKMSKGIALTDEDRLPWLESLREAAAKHMATDGCGVVLTCSALQRKYREILRRADTTYAASPLGDCSACRVKFVCLETTRDVVAGRVRRRAEDGSHFMPVSLVESQFQLLHVDEDEHIFKVDVALGLESVVGTIQAHLHKEIAGSMC